MQLILKPTSACNFACNFCSAKDIKLQQLTSIPEKLKQLLMKLKPQNIIITGGEPLLCPASFYEELLAFATWTLSFTTNLKAFYEKPEIWTPLFKDKRVGVCTSFQYGSGRCWTKDQPYSEKMFIDVAHLFYDNVGYVPPFISVISEENAPIALKHLELAKKLCTKCKLNGMLPFGLSKEFFPRWKLLKIWLDAIDAGYKDQLDIEVPTKIGGCGFNTNLMCSSTIRACAVTIDGELLYSQCEEDLNAKKNLLQTDESCPTPQQDKLPVEVLISKKCLACRLCRLCNGCKHAREASKLDPRHCEEMKKLESRILAAGWRLEHVLIVR